MSRAVTERDLRMPEFRDVKVEDLEFRSDGKLVRKDRWESAINTIRHMVSVGGREYEIGNVVNAVAELANQASAIEEAISDDIWTWIREGGMTNLTRCGA